MIPASIAFYSQNGETSFEQQYNQQCVVDLKEATPHHKSTQLSLFRGEPMDILEARIRQAHQLLRSSNDSLGKTHPQNKPTPSYTVVKPFLPRPLWGLKRTYSQTLIVHKSDRTVDTVTTTSSHSTVSDATSYARSREQPQETAVASISTAIQMAGDGSSEWGYFVDVPDVLEETDYEGPTAGQYRSFLSTEIQRSAHPAQQQKNRK